MGSGVIFTPGHFNKVKAVLWSDVTKKYHHDKSVFAESIEFATPDLIKLENSTYLPGSLRIFKEIIDDPRLHVDKGDVHTYISYGPKARTYGRHNDKESVLLVQIINEMSYKFDDGSVCVLRPGDSLFIPSGVYHDPKPIAGGPRVTLSMSITE